MSVNSQIVHAYFEASNKGDLEKISHLLQESCTYSSDNTGIFFGKGSILSMMNGFFSKFKSLHWTIDEFTELTDDIIEIQFTLLMEDMHGGTSAKNGTECIVIQDTLIRHIEVRNKIL